MLKSLLIYLILISYSSLYAFQLDKKLKKDDNKFWSAHYNVPKYSFIGLVGLSAYEGSQTRLGKTSWKSLDSVVMSQVITEILKKSTKRNRPRDTNSPNEWNKNGNSFPSGHVSGMTAMVTPFILEYQDDYPMIHLLWTLPLYQIGGRLKAQAHWQSDVIGGFLVGFGSGYWASKRDFPLLLYFDGDKSYVGLRYKF